jgi:type IV pilus assembly protein PilM
VSLGVGIDVGGSSVTVAAVRSRKGSLALEGFLHVPLEALAADGVPVDDPAAVARAVAVRLQQRGVKASGAVLGVSGRDAIIRYSLLPPMPAWRMELLMELEVKDTAEKTGEALSADWRQLAGANEGNLVLIALAKDARVLESVSAWQKAGVEAGGALPLPVATGDCYRFLGDGVADKVTLVLDIGKDSTEVAIVEMGELIFARSVQTGGEAFTERLAKVLGVSRDEAEQIKKDGQDEAGSDVAGALSGPRQQLAAMVVASVDFARGQLRRKKLAIERCVVSGGGARAPGLVDTLAKSLGCPAALFDPVAGIDCSRADRVAREDAEAHGLEAATAIGLALSSALPNASRLDLLPLQIKKQLEFKHRTLFEYLAAGVAVAALVVALGAALIERGGQRDRSVALGAAKASVAARLQAHEGRAADNAKREAELRGLSERARPGYALARLLGTIAEGLPQKLSLTELNLVRDEKAGTVTLEVRGLADNAQGDGAEAMRALKQAVEADPEVASASVTPLANEGPTLEFSMSIVPVGGQGTTTEAPPADTGKGE